MAVTSGRVESTVGGNWSKFYVNWQQSSQSTANNSTTINWQAGLYTGTSSSHDFWYSNAVKITNVTINGSTVSNGGTWSNIKSAGDNQLLTGSLSIPHNNDGTKTFSISITGWLYGSGNKSGSGSFTLTNIPRKTTVTLSVSKRDETSLIFTWNAADIVDYSWYSTNNGSTWTGKSITEGTSGSYTVEGLSAGTTYNCKIKVRRKDSQLESDPSTTAAQTTYSIPTQSLKSKTETSITMNWNIDSTANYIWYSKDNGTNWTAVGAVNATSGSYTISGLNAGTTYNIRTRIRRSGSGTYYTNGTNNLPVTTHPYPSIANNGVSKTELTIGQSQTLTLNNPLSRSVTVYMKQNNTSGTTLYSGTTSGTSITFTPTASTLYNSIPNSTINNCVYYVVYSNQTSATQSGTYKIDNAQGQHNPTFALSNWSYTANFTNLTNNNQVVINNKSTVTFSIDTAATAKDGTTIDYYLFEWGTVSKKSTDGNTIANGNGNLLKVTAFDKRGYYTLTTLNLDTNYIDYKNITYSASTAREDGVEANTTLKITGTLFHQNFGSSGTLNQFTSAKYYTSTDNSTWSTAYTIPVSNITYNSNNYTLNNYQIHANGSSGGFTVGTRYYVKIDLTDSLSTVTFTTTVTDGKIAEDTFQDSNGNYHRGINGLANSNYTLTVHGNTLSNGQVFRNTGSSWIGDRDTAVARNNDGTQNGNYKSVISQKTKDGNWTIGNLSGDNNLYFNYTTDTNYNNNNNQSSRWTISNSGTFSGKASTAGTADTANKLGTSNVGSSDRPIYLNAGTPTQCNTPASSNYFRGVPFISSGGVMEIGRYIDFHPTNASTLDYSKRLDAGTGTTARTITIPDESGTIQLKPTSLYDNSSGSAGNITLSDSVANYTYLTIYFCNNNGLCCDVSEFYNPQGKSLSLTTFEIANLRNSMYNVNNKALNYNNGIYREIPSGAQLIGNYIKILKVIGWK